MHTGLLLPVKVPGLLNGIDVIVVIGVNARRGFSIPTQSEPGPVSRVMSPSELVTHHSADT